jgi:hypothetical protein
VKSTDTACPFCTVSLPPDFASTRRVKVAPHHQITRAAVAFAGVTTAAGCSFGLSTAYGVIILEDASFNEPGPDAAGDAADASDAADAPRGDAAQDSGTDATTCDRGCCPPGCCDLTMVRPSSVSGVRQESLAGKEGEAT